MGRKKLEHIYAVHELENVLMAMKIEEGLDLSALEKFLNGASVTLELGCGYGEYTLALAEKFPERKFIGVDRKGYRIWNGAKKALEMGLKNVFFVQTRIDSLMEFFPSNSIDEIWITFPDPYSKPSKANHRLTSEKYLEAYKSILRPHANLNLKTDSIGMFDYSLQSLEKDWEILEINRDLHGKKNLAEILQIKTAYEKKYIAEGKPINYLKACVSDGRKY